MENKGRVNSDKFSRDITGDFYTTVDGFGYDAYARAIHKMIIDVHFPSPFTFSIFGEWGSGKTSLMRMIEALLGDDLNKFVPVWFNPWRYEKEKHLIIPFLKTIQDSLSRHINAHEAMSTTVKEKLICWIKKMGNATRAIAYGLKGKFDLMVVKVEVDASKSIDREEALNKKKEEKTEYSSMYYNILSSLEEISKQEPLDLRIAVFIDDLDRCLPEKVIEMLESIKLFLDIPGYIFFIGVDHKVVEKGVRVKYEGYVIDEKVHSESAGHDKGAQGLPITPTDYLEKMIQLPIYLPPIEKSRVNSYIRALIGDHKDLEPYLDIIELGLKRNPRTYKRFMNTLAFHKRLAREKKLLEEPNLEANESDTPKTKKEDAKPKMKIELLVKWTLINFAFQDLVEAMKTRKLLLTEIQDFSWRKEKESQEIRPGLPDEKTQSKIEVPEYIKRWLMNDKLMHILRKDTNRGDMGFQKDDIDLYLQMGEFSFPNVITSVSFAHNVHVPIGKMVKIPKGKFLYGKSKRKKNIDHDFEIGAYPVTNSEYKEFLNDKENKEYSIPEDWNEDKRTFPEGKEHHPVVNVSFYDALKYCEWKTEKEKEKLHGYKYRLPTEFEWEKAARGTDGREYPWGDEFDKGKCNSDESGINDTTPVDKYPDGVSPYGCYDMSGNVLEWVNSWYPKKMSRVLRGGSWANVQNYARAVYQCWLEPDVLSNFIGFRVVLSAQ